MRKAKRTLVRVRERLAQQISASRLASLTEILPSTRNDVRQPIDDAIPHLSLLRRSQVGKLGDDGVDSRLMNHENAERGGASVAN